MMKFFAVLLAILLMFTTAFADGLVWARDELNAINNEFASQYADTDYYNQLAEMALQKYGEASGLLLAELVDGNVTKEESTKVILSCWTMCVELTNCVNASTDSSISYLNMLSDGDGTYADSIALNESYRQHSVMEAMIHYYTLSNLVSTAIGDTIVTEKELLSIRERVALCNEFAAQRVDPLNKEKLIEQLELMQE